MARLNRKFLEGLPHKLGTHWQRRFFFVKYLREYPLKHYWKDAIDGVANEPDSSEEMNGYLLRIREAPYERRTFAFLTSARVLQQVRKDLPSGEPIFL